MVAAIRRGFVGMFLGSIRPAILGDYIRVDEGAARKQRCETLLDERRFAGTVRSDDKVETSHKTICEPSGRYFTTRPCSSSEIVARP